jgi:hypothetical protein
MYVKSAILVNRALFGQQQGDSGLITDGFEVHRGFLRRDEITEWGRYTVCKPKTL